MKWTLFLILLSIGLVAGGGAWKESKEYKYKLIAKTFVTFPGSNKQNGAISRVLLTIRPQSDVLLIGQITQAGFTEIDEQDEHDSQDSNMSEKSASLNDVAVNQQFKINLKNGVIDSLSVDRSMTTHQINQLKFIVSQFQVDTKAQNVMQSENNHLPDANTNSAFYTTMEPTVTGECETTYDISRLPEYLAYAKRESIPLPELPGETDVFEIVKNKNYNNCNERGRYLLDLAGQKDDTNRMESDPDVTLNTDILITGTLDNYTIQSSITTNKVAGVKEYIYLTLESLDSVEQLNADSNYTYSPRFENMENIGSLVYTIDDKKNQLQAADTKNRGRLMSTGLQVSDNDNVVEEQWSGCWTAFPSAASICKDNISPEWIDIDSACCGIFCLGKKAKCRHSYPGCEATACYSVFYSQGSLCNRSFGARLPITKGGFDDCAPGFYRARCCPKYYE